MKMKAFIVSFIGAIIVGLFGLFKTCIIMSALAAFFLCWEITKKDD